MFFKRNFFMAYGSVPLTPTNIKEITTIKLYDGMYDELFITNNMDSDENDSTIQQYWDKDTVFHAKFDGNTWAGTFGVDMDEITDILVKRRMKGTNEWTTIKAHSITTAKKPEEFNFHGVDFLARSNHEYEYAVVSYCNGLEGNYDINPIKSEFNCVVVAGQDKSYSTSIEMGGCDFTRVGTGSTQELLNRKYPIKYQYGQASYDTGSVSGCWMQYVDGDLDTENAIDYMMDFKDYLGDGKAKIIKHPDGREWLVSVDRDSGITDTSENYVFGKRIISFNVTEVGDYNSEKDLYENKISDVSPEYWSRAYV